MIKRYFNSLSQLQTEQKSMETDNEK
jgi:hypothetical protein